MSALNFDADKHRDPHEPEHHWALRKRFLEHNMGRYSEEKLVSLAQVFANMEFLGCRYPKETMETVNELSFGVVQEYREQMKGRLQRTFVSGSAAASGKVNRSAPAGRGGGGGGGGNKRNSDGSFSDRSKASLYGNFVAASASDEASGGSFKKTYNEASASNESSASNEASSTSADEPPAKKFVPKSIIEAPPPPADEDRPPVVPEIKAPSQRWPRFSNRAYNYSKPVFNPRDPLTRFIVVLLEYHEDEHPCNILNRSAGFCRMPASWEYRQKPSGGHVCVIKIDNRVVSTAVAETKQAARDEAARTTVEKLMKRCYSVAVRDKFVTDGTTVNADDVQTEGMPADKAVGPDSVGHKLLKMMGWSGGGLGKGGSGISEPITAASVINREGIGSKSAAAEFKAKVRKIVEEYAASANPYDLVFTSGFDNEQRKEMHMIAKRLGLKSKSFGKDDGRFITVSRKFDAAQIIEELIRRGGSNEKYILVPPNSAAARTT